MKFPEYIDVRIRIKTRRVRRWWSLWLVKTDEAYEEFEVLRRFEVVIGGKTDVVEAGSTGDGASIPKWLRSLISAVRCLVGGIVHDDDYATHSRSREEADERFYFALVHWARMPRWKAWLAWLAVHLFGKRHWDAKNKTHR